MGWMSIGGYLPRLVDGTFARFWGAILNEPISTRFRSHSNRDYDVAGPRTTIYHQQYSIQMWLLDLILIVDYFLDDERWFRFTSFPLSDSIRPRSPKARTFPFAFSPLQFGRKKHFKTARRFVGDISLTLSMIPFTVIRWFFSLNSVVCFLFLFFIPFDKSELNQPQRKTNKIIKEKQI